MPTKFQQTNIADAITAIRSAQNLLQEQINMTTDVLQCIKLNNQYNGLDSCLSQLLHAQNATDDGVFASTVMTLKSQTAGLQKDEATINRIISDVGAAGKLVDYISKALTCIAGL